MMASHSLSVFAGNEQPSTVLTTRSSTHSTILLTVGGEQADTLLVYSREQNFSDH